MTQTMTYDTTARALKSAMTNLKRIANQQSSRPILRGVLVSPTSIRATDLDISVSYHVPTGVSAPIVVSPIALGRALAGARPKDEVTLRTRDDDALLVCYNGLEIPVPEIANADEFPDRSYDANFAMQTMDAKSLLRSLKRVSVCAAKDWTRFQMHSVCFDVTGACDGTTIVATDGKRMAIDTIALTADVRRQVIVPLPAIDVTLSALKGANVAELSLTDEEYRCTAGSYTIESRTVDGKYPQWDRAIPQSPEKRYWVSTRQLAALPIKASQFPKEQLSARYAFDHDRLTISAECIGTLAIAVDNARGPLEPEGVSLNPRYMLELLGSCDCKQLEFCWTSPKTALLIHDSDPDSNFSFIVMPLIASEAA